MIAFDGVSRWHRLGPGQRRVIYDNLTLTLPGKTNIGILGRNGAGKSTLMRLISGVERPDRGTITTDGRVSPPIGIGNLSGQLSGVENTKFVCRILGDSAAATAERLRFVREFAQLDEYFEQPVRTYSSGMRARLGFALSMAFEYDYYLIDEVTAVGDERFRRRANALLESKRGKAGLLIVSHSMDMLRERCQAGLVVARGSAQYYDDIESAIQAYRKNKP